MADSKKNQAKSPSKKSIVAQAEAKADKIVKDNAKAKAKGHQQYCGRSCCNVRLRYSNLGNRQRTRRFAQAQSWHISVFAKGR